MTTTPETRTVGARFTGRLSDVQRFLQTHRLQPQYLLPRGEEADDLVRFDVSVPEPLLLEAQAYDLKYEIQPRVIRARFTGRFGNVQRFLQTHRLEPHFLSPIKENVDLVRFEAFAPEALLRDVRAYDLKYEIQLAPFSDTVLRERRDDVGKGNRFANADKSLPQAAGRGQIPSPPELYFNVDEAETALANLADAYGNLAALVPLDYASVQGRGLTALHLRKNDGIERPAIVLLGCVHGDEWGSCEILIRFAAGLLEAHSGNGGLDFGGSAQFLHADVEKILDDMEIVIFPVVNPDGRKLSQEAVTFLNIQLGRENANQVDLNRNFDVLFDYRGLLKPGAPICVNHVAGAMFYQGPGPFSEPETRNVQWLLNEFPRTRWLVDLHAAGYSINYGWGCDEVQEQDHQMTFTNLPKYQQSWGKPGDCLQEYVINDHMNAMKSMADQFVICSNKVSNTGFFAQRAFTNAATPGTSHDYAFSRHRTEGKEVIFQFYVEWGVNDVQPTLVDMERTVQEVSAGLIGLCLNAQ